MKHCIRLTLVGCCLAAAACSANTPSAPVVSGYTVATENPPPSQMSVGSPVTVVIAVSENKSDGSVQPAANQSVVVDVTAGGGTVNGSQSATVTTDQDGTASVTWLLGPAVGTQSLRGSVSSTAYLDVALAAVPLPTLLIVNGTCAGGHCDSIDVVAFPDNQPESPGGLWRFPLDTVTGPEACVTFPPSASFTVSGSGDTSVNTWTPAIPVALGLESPLGSLFTTPSTAEVVSMNHAGWRVTLPGTAVVSDTACTP